MANNSRNTHTNPSPIKEFPGFTKLTFGHRKEYEALTKDFPPVSDFSLIKILDWWEHFGEVGVATLDGNLVVSFGNYFDHKSSGFSFVGTRNVDASLCTIFDHLRKNNQDTRIVNVPEFAIHSLEYPELFKVTPSPKDDEYVIRAAQFADIKNLSPIRRSRIKRFMRNMIHSNIEVKPLDLRIHSNRQAMIQAIDVWPRKGINALGKLESSVLKKRIREAAHRGTQNACILIDGELQAYCHYYVLHDKSYAVLSHARVNYDIPGLFDYMTHAFSRYFTDQGFQYVNIHSDLDSIRMRIVKLALKPAKFFRKYTVEPLPLPESQTRESHSAQRR